MNQTTQLLPGAGAQLVGGRYELGQVLGRGGVADVLRAHDRVLERDVAIKIFRPATASGLDQRGHSAEIRALAGLRHPGLVALLDAGTDHADTAGTVAERTYLIMELVEGPSLGDRLADGPLEPGTAIALGAGLADTLAYVHSRGVVHRDIKPANILLDDTTGTTRPRLTDFGVARLLDSTRLTEVGMTVGTANYLSPEQAAGGEIGPATDVYALGLVLLECLTGRVEYPGAGVAAAAARLHRDPVIPPHIGERWQGLLAAMTARDPNQRPPAAHVAEVLRGQRSAVPVPVPAAAAAAAATMAMPAASPAAGSTVAIPVPLATPNTRRRRGVWVACFALAAAMLAIALVALTSSSGSPAPSPAAPVYPTASGALGDSLRQLESLVGAPQLSAAARLRLQSDTLAVARAIAHQDAASAQAALGDLGTDVTSLRSSGLLAANDASAITAVIPTVTAQLATLTPSATPSPTPTTSPADGKHGDHGNGNGDGGGGPPANGGVAGGGG